MMRSRFDEDMALLHQELAQMGDLCEQAIGLTAKALAGERALAKKVGALEGEIDQAERDIESLCLKLLLRQQPVARDLRQVSAALKMITDLERIGDQASDIADIITEMEAVASRDVGHIWEMAQSASGMVNDSVDAYIKGDVALARQVIADDDVIDSAFQQVKAALVELMAQHGELGEYALDLLMIAKYFERIGDHAVNVAEWVIFAITGEKKE